MRSRLVVDGTLRRVTATSHEGTSNPGIGLGNAESFFRYVVQRLQTQSGDAAVDQLMQDYLAVHPTASEDESRPAPGLSESEFADLDDTIFSSAALGLPSKVSSGHTSLLNECAVCLMPFKENQVTRSHRQSHSTYDHAMSHGSQHILRRDNSPLPAGRGYELHEWHEYTWSHPGLSAHTGLEAAAMQSHFLQALHLSLDGGPHHVPYVPLRLPLRKRSHPLLHPRCHCTQPDMSAPKL